MEAPFAYRICVKINSWYTGSRAQKGARKGPREMVRNISGKLHDDLYDEVVKKSESIGLTNNSQMLRYAFAIFCGYSSEKARLIAIISPDVSPSEYKEAVGNAS